METESILIKTEHSLAKTIVDDDMTQIIATFDVAGVTYSNGSRSRQTILRRIMWKDEPYHNIELSDCIDLVKTTYEGAPAVEVWVKTPDVREHIGYVPKELAELFSSKWRYMVKISPLEVTGGNIHDGERNYFGASLSVAFVENEGLLNRPLRPYNPSLGELNPVPVTDKGYRIRAVSLFHEKYPEYLEFHLENRGTVNIPSYNVFDNSTQVAMFMYDPLRDYLKIKKVIPSFPSVAQPPTASSPEKSPPPPFAAEYRNRAFEVFRRENPSLNHLTWFPVEGSDYKIEITDQSRTKYIVEYIPSTQSIKMFNNVVLTSPTSFHEDTKPITSPSYQPSSSSGKFSSFLFLFFYLSFVIILVCIVVCVLAK